jgi:FKBP-type peptidyl-prolyl cis-trans isomerase
MIKKIFIALLVLGILASIGWYATKPPSEEEIVKWGLTPSNQPQPTTTESTQSALLSIQEIKEGTGAAVKIGDSVVMHYKGSLQDGTVFDSSYDRGQPFETQIGVGEVIKGWDQGVPGMKVGGQRLLVIPPNLGYGESGSPPKIPPNATLFFEVELIEIK